MSTDNQGIDSIFKIYRNSEDNIIGVHRITVTEDRKLNPDPIPGKIRSDRFKRRAYITTDFRRILKVLGESRVIARVQFFGRYDDFTYNDDETDLISVSYNGDASVNSLEISLKDLPTIGEEL